jgi:Lectin C-type domain
MEFEVTRRRVAGVVLLGSGLSCTAVLGLDEPTHRDTARDSAAGGGAGSTGTAGMPAGAAGQTGSAGGAPPDTSDGSGGMAMNGGGGVASEGGAGKPVADANPPEGGRDAAPDASGGSCAKHSECATHYCSQNVCQPFMCQPNSAACTCVKQGNTFYRYCVAPVDSLPWALAKQKCEDVGMHLATVENAAELNYLGSISGTFWVGATIVAGQFQWTDQTPVASSLWAPGQPAAGRACVIVSSDLSGLQSGTCSDPHFYLCESF